MNKIALLVLLLASFVAPAFAAAPLPTFMGYPAAAKLYLSDKDMVDLLVDKAMPDMEVLGYCTTVGPALIEKYGDKHPLLVEVGLGWQVAENHKVACISFVQLSKIMTADEVRALVTVLGTTYVADAKNNEGKMTIQDLLKVIGFPSFKFSSAGALSFFLSANNQPNGYPRPVLDFIKPLYLGQTEQARQVLRSYIPGNEVKKALAATAAIEDEKK